MFSFSTFAETPFSALREAFVDGQVAIEAAVTLLIGSRMIRMNLLR